MASPTKKIPADIWWLDAQEHRADMEAVCRWIAFALLAASFVFDLILVMDFSRAYQIAQFSQDEYWFLEEIMRLQGYLTAGDFSSIRQFGSPFAYGFGFWLFTALIAAPFRGHVMLTTLFLRLVFMAMKYAAFWIVYRRAFDLTRKPIFSLLALALLLAVPAYVFDGKIISPEYLIMLLGALGWDALFRQNSNARTAAAFFFGLAAVIKINTAPLAIIFLALWFAYPKRDRFRIALDWGVGLIVPLLLFLFPASPFREILAIASTHHVDYGLNYLFVWYNYNALEFDDMLKGGWSVAFLSWPFLLVLVGFAIYQDVRIRGAYLRDWAPTTMAAVFWTFYAGLVTCILTSLNSLMHPWFVFAPFMLMLGAGTLLIGIGRQGTTMMAAFLVAYIAFFGPRYAVQWQHRVQKFDYVAQTETWDAGVSAWIAENCPKARQGVIDYNLLWPETYNGHLQKMWTLIEVEDFRRTAGDASSILDNIDLLLLKTSRMKALLPPPDYKPQPKVTGAILGNFFPNAAPYYNRTKEFPDLTLYVREGVCKK